MMVVINLSAVAILIRRLGLTWTVFEPSNSLLQAEGKCMVVNSIKFPAVGTVLEFDRFEKISYSMIQAEIFIPGRHADALGFGLIRPWFDDDDSYMKVGSSEEYTNTMLWYLGWCLTRESRNLVESNPMQRCLADFVGLTSQVIFIKGTQITRIPDPSPNSRGILCSYSAPKVFGERILNYTSKHQCVIESDVKHLHWIQES